MMCSVHPHLAHSLSALCIAHGSCMSSVATRKAVALKDWLGITWRPAALAGELSETWSIFAKGLLLLLFWWLGAALAGSALVVVA